MSHEAHGAFLAGVHVAILATDSLEARCLRAAGRATVTIQEQAPSYRYASVEGPVTELTKQRDVHAVAARYLGEELGARYAAQITASASSVLVRLTPEHWRTQDFNGAG